MAGWWWPWPNHRRRAALYGLTSFSLTIIHNVFLLYYVDIFQNEYGVSTGAFFAGETVFMVWNSVNDPLFGWISDVGVPAEEPASGGRPPSRVLRRLRTLALGGPCLALSFLAFWFPWFVACLCLYDSFLTLVELNQQALLADLTLQLHERTEMSSAASVMSVFGSASVFVSYWARGSLPTFRLFVIIIAAISAAGFTLAAAGLRQLLPAHEAHPVAVELAVGAAQVHHAEPKVPIITVRQYASQMLGHRNFVWFSCMNVIQVFHCHFNSNFFPVFLRHLLGASISSDAVSVLLGLSFVVPHINNVFFSQLSNRAGVYAVVRGLFVTKLLLAVVMGIFGPRHTALLCVFIASNRIFTEGTCKLLNLVVSDLVDEDYVLHQRPQAVAALVFGTANLLAKPGQTLAPVLGTLYLRAQHVGVEGTPAGAEAQGAPDRSSQADAIFSMLVLVPVVCALLQLAAWSRFRLHGAQLREVKHAIVVRQREEAPERNAEEHA